MVRSCAMVGCTSRFKKGEIGMFDLPKVNARHSKKLQEETLHRRKQWLLAINRKDLEKKNLTYVCVCSRHFLNGKPAKLKDKTHPDWVPMLNLSHAKQKSRESVQRDSFRHGRAETRKSKIPTQQRVVDMRLDKSLQVDLIRELGISKCSKFVQTELFSCDHFNDDTDIVVGSKILSSNKCCSNYSSMENENINDKSCQVSSFDLSVSVGTQTDGALYYNFLEDQIKVKRSELHTYAEECNELKLNQDSFVNNNSKVRYYTGLKCYGTLLTIVEAVQPFIAVKKKSTLSQFQHILLFLMRMRLYLGLQDLAYRFSISVSSACRIFHNCLDIFYCRLHRYVHFPTRENLQKTMPIKFQITFGKRVVCILDCFEIFTYIPSNLKAQGIIFSNYKGHVTAKFLIAITPQGFICFVSSGYGGRSTDLFIVTDSKFLDNIMPGDIILADRGFDLKDVADIFCFEVKTPAFAKGVKQFSPASIEETRKVSHLRTDVERIIGLVKNKYRICKGPVPVSYLKKDESGMSPISKIVYVASVLVNHTPSVINFNST